MIECANLIESVSRKGSGNYIIGNSQVVSLIYNMLYPQEVRCAKIKKILEQI